MSRLNGNAWIVCAVLLYLMFPTTTKAGWWCSIFENKCDEVPKICESCGFINIIDCSDFDCTDKKESGFCNGYFGRYYYDEKDKQCKDFIYGGCLGTKNRFKTKKDCEKCCVIKDD
ncbi:kunitz-type serine protease inhibitor BmKTT-2-like [Styela clava]